TTRSSSASWTPGSSSPARATRSATASPWTSMRDAVPTEVPGEVPAETPAGPRRRGRPGYDQATVVRRAVDLFNRQGYDATSVGDIAKEVGVSQSAIYHHVD